jgi:hypothetical protein
VLAIVLAGCNSEVLPPSHINATEVLMVRHSVELGPLYPDRVGPTFVGMDKAPIAEVLPGDRLQLEPVVVDIDGVPLAPDELDTLWLQCGFSCFRPGLTFADPRFDEPCIDRDPYTTDDYCLLGTGDGRFEIEVPQLGDNWWFDLDLDYGAHMSLYAVIAWDGRSAEDCWTARRTEGGPLDGCGFIYHDVEIGPYWTAMIHAASLGIDTPSPFGGTTLPSWLTAHQANRVPLTPAVTVLVDGAMVATGVPPLPPIPIERGATFEVELTFDPLSQSLQRIFTPLDSSFTYWELVDERLYSTNATSGAIWKTGDDDDEEPVVGNGSFPYAVDPSARPGTSRVLIIYGDQLRARDFLSLEFDVR